MKVRELIKALQQVPPDSEVEDESALHMGMRYKLVRVLPRDGTVYLIFGNTAEEKDEKD